MQRNELNVRKQKSHKEDGGKWSPYQRGKIQEEAHHSSANHREPKERECNPARKATYWVLPQLEFQREENGWISHIGTKIKARAQ